MKNLIVFLLFQALLFSCTTPKIEQEKQEMILADKEFSNLSENEGMKVAFLAYADSDAVLLRPNSYPIVGYEEITKRLKSASDTAFKLTWEPSGATIAASCDFGFTYGIYTASSKDSLGNPLKNVGTYVSIWKKGKNGKWKYILDTGNQGLGKK